MQIPNPHDVCPPSNQTTTIAGIVAGTFASIIAWFKEDLFGISSKRRKEYEEYKCKVDTLMEVHNADERDRLIRTRVAEELRLALEQRSK